jgi:integrase
VTLARAREIAEKWRPLIASGIDPIERRKEQRAAERTEAAKAMTFDDCRTAYIAGHEASWRNPKHRQQWANTLTTYVTPVFGKLPVQAVDTALVLKVIEPIWTIKPETASRVRGRIETLLDWAKTRELRTGENPARWRGHLEHMLPAKSKVRKVSHHAALPFKDVGAFLLSLREQSSISAAALEFVILNATRTNETLRALWAEVSVTEKLWTIPGERMKGGQEHRVPLSDAAVSVLKRMEAVRQDDLVFPGARKGQPMSEMALLMLLRRMAHADVTVHGFRSSFRDWAAERTAFPREIAEKALAHIVGDETERAYQRGDLLDKRRKLMDAWASYCAKDETAGAKVVPIASRA